MMPPLRQSRRLLKPQPTRRFLRHFHPSLPDHLNTPSPKQPPQPSSPSPPDPHTPHAHSSRPPRPRPGRFSLPLFLFFAATFGAITSYMDTSPRRSTSPSSSPSSQYADTSDLDASPTSTSFVDDDGNPITAHSTSSGYYDNGEQGEIARTVGVRDVAREQAEDTFGRHERVRRVPWTVREQAQAERWVRESGRRAVVQREIEGWRGGEGG